MKSILHHLVSRLSSMFRKNETEAIAENGLSFHSRLFEKKRSWETFLASFLSLFFGSFRETNFSLFGIVPVSKINRLKVNSLAALCLVTLMGMNVVSAQTTVYSTNFGTASTTNVASITGWSISGAQSANLTLATTSNSSTYTSPISFSAGANLADGSTSSVAGTAVATLAGQVNTTGLTNIEVAFGYRASSASYTATVTFEWSADGTTWNNIPITLTRDGSWRAINGTSWLTLPSGAQNQSNLRFRFTFVRANTSGNFRIDDFTVRGAGTPVISTTGTLAAVNTTYGSASATPTSFNVSGTTMNAGILVTPPSGYEVSLASGSGYAATVTVGTSGTIASTPVFVRLKSTATVAGSPYSGNIVLSSSGASSVNVATVSSAVSPKALTITGIAANNKLFDGNTAATLSGTPSLVGVVNSDVVTLGGTPVATFASSAVGTAISVSVTGYTISGAGAGNYTLTQPSLTADITSTPAPVISSTLTASAVYGTPASTYTITASESPTSYNATGLPAGLSVNTSTGEITGTPTAAPGTFNVTISATNAGGTGSATLVYTITAKNLTVTGATVTSKTYDRTTTATISGSTLVGVFGADVVSISTTGTFASATAGTGILVTSTQTLGGAAAGNYTLTLPLGLTGNITPLALTIATPVAANKVFDGNNTATITGTLTGVIAPDVVTLSLSGTFASSAIGSGIAVTSTSTISGADAANYTLTQPTGLTASITEPTIYVNAFTGTAACPTQGNTATVASNATGSALTRSTITCQSTANVFNSTTLNVTASVSNTSYIEFSATAASGYVLNLGSMSFFRQASNSAPNQLEVRYSTDGFATFTAWGAAPVTPTTGTVATWDFPNFTTAGGGTVTFRIYPYGTQRADLTGAPSATGTFRLDDVTIYGTVTALPAIATTGTLSALTTTYGTASSETSFNVSGTNMTAGVLVTPPAGYEVSTTSGSGFAATVTVGAAGTITSTPVYVRLAATTAVGSYAGNIVLSSAGATSVNVATVSSTVTPANIPVNGLTANNKPYDGTTAATLSGTPTLSGIVPGDEPNVILGGTPVANFATAAVGTGIAVTVTGYTISGSASGNYTLVQPTGLTADITAVSFPTITSALTASATYGAATSYTITASGTPDSYNATGLPAGLTVNTATGEISGTPTVAGTFNVTISATNAGGTGNATLVYTIAPKALTITGAIADSKVYDRTTTATISGSTLVGIVGADDVTVSNTGTFDTANAGTGKAVTSTQTLSGADASKYTLTLPTGLTADITPKALTIGSAAAQNKPYDTTNVATITGTLTGVIAPDAVTVNLTGTFASSVVGTGIAVTSTSTLSGADAANYSLAQPTGLTANITAVPTFTYGNLVVARIGTGSAALTNAANPVFLNEYSTTGSAGITVALPSTTAGSINRILESGTSTSEAQLNLSTDGQYLTIGGYDAVVGQASVNSTAGIPRVIARVNNAGTIATSVLTSTIHSSGFRSVVTTDGSRYWTAGNGVGVTSLLHQGNTTPIAPTTISATVTNLRTVNIFNNQLYVSTGSGTQGIYKVGTGVPTTTGQTSVINIPQNGLYAYQMVNRGGSNWNCYAVGDSSAGIYKWSSTDNGANWTARGSVSNALPIYGITAANNGTSVDLYFTTVSAVLKLTDSAAFSANLTGTPSTVVTAPTNTAFRGIAFAPISASAPLIATTGSPAAVNTTYGTASATPGTFTVSGNNLTTDIVLTAPAGFEISKDGSSYATTQTLTQTSGVVASTTIYVRLAATTLAGTYSGNITCVSAPASSVNVALAASTVSPLALTTTGAVANNKVYNRTTAATISGATLSATVNGDIITISGGGSFADFNVGTAKPVTAALTLSGTNASSYTLTQPTGLTADITAKDLTIAGASANNKVYDGNTSATLSGTLTGVIAPDDVSLNASAFFDSAAAGTAIPVTSTSTLSGADVANYNLVEVTGLVADITPKQLTVASATAQNKVFDGNTNAIITGTLVGVVAPDDVTFVGTGTFATAAVGTGIAVTSTSTIVGDIANYTLLQPTGLTANITAATLVPQTITFNPLADVVYGSGTFNLTATSDSGLTVSYTSSNPSVATVLGNVVTVVGVGSTTITASQAGDSIYDAATPVDQNLNVTPKALTVTATADNKVYDGTYNATITGTLNGVVGADVVTFNGIGGFDTLDAGTGINVTSFSTLGGAQASNYTLTQPTGLTANITPKDLTVIGAAAANKVYDGTTAATINGSTLLGIVGSDDVTVVGTGTFATKNVGNGIAVTGALTLAGTQAANYTLLTQPTGLTANITPKALTIGGLLGGNKVYDGTTAATLIGTGSLVGVEGADVVTLSGTPVAVFATASAGTAKPLTISGYTISGADATNYTLAQPTGIVADITPATLTLTAVSALNKPFDGTTAATINGLLSGIISPDVVTLVGTGVFASSAIGTGIAVTSTATLSGAAAGNYTLTQPTGLTANITAAATVFAVGDLSIIGFQLNAPDSFAFATWVDITDGTLVKFTDNAFLSNASANLANNARGSENFIIWKNNTGAVIPAGTVITISDNTSAGITSLGTIVSGNLSGLSASGDNIFAYQGPATSGAFPDFASVAATTTFNGTVLFGLYAQGTNTLATWQTTGAGATTSSYLPAQLLSDPTSNIALASNASRGQYIGARNNQLTYNAYKAQVTNPANWTTAAGAGTLTLDTTVFTLMSPAAITATGTLSAVDTVYGTASATPTTFTVSGADLENNLVLTAPAGFEISTDGIAYATTQTLVPSSGTVAATTISVRLAATTVAGTYSGNITCVSSPAVTVNVATVASTVSPLAITTTGAVANNKVYDRTTAATISGATAVGTVNGDVITVSGGGTFASANAGTAIAVTAALTLSGTNASSYTLTQPTGLSADITPKALTIGSAAASNKVFDGNTDAVITGTLTGVIAPDVVTFNGTGTFASSAVGTGIAVTSTSTLTGADAANYSLTQPTGLTANITAAPLLPQTITFNALANVVYGDANFNLTATASSGLTVSYVSSNTSVATIAGDVVTIVGVGTTTITATQAGDSVYDAAPSVNQTLTVTPKALTVTASANNKVYDRTAAATITGTLNGIVGADVVTFNGTGTFATANAGTGIAVTSTSTISGAQAGNYTLTQPTGLTADITPKALTIGSAAASNKVFDGTTAATITGTLTGIISPDVVTLVGTGTFASSAVGTGIAVTSTATLAGAAAANYSLTQPTGLTANITVAPTVFAVGDLSIIGFQWNTPDSFAFATWVDINPNTYIKFTDNAFLSAASANATNNGRGGENFVIWRNNGAVIPAGSVITITDNTTVAITNNGTIVSGNLNGLSAAGDNIFAYQGAATSGTNPDWSTNTNPTTFNGTILFGLYGQGTSVTTSWITTGIATSNNSYLPSQLNVANGNIALGGLSSRGQYIGSRNNQTTFNAYKALVTNPANWTTAAGAGTLTFNTTSFTLATAPTASVISGSATICAGASTNLSVAVTGGTAPFTVVYTDGTTNFTASGYVSGTSIAVTPASTTTYTLVSVTDANTLVGTGNTGAAVVTVNSPTTWYADADSDTFGDAATTTLACTQPSGYVADSSDCDDTNINIYQFATFYVDADGDTYGSTTSASVCSGLTTPSGYSTTNDDCNDADPLLNPTNPCSGGSVVNLTLFV
ncbi:YDG domain-containing protein, partial [Flavobacterium sp.]|uniref:YDG domain-containing protein n=1 Tax=Flavobacterium sp. TaxID=239 RepID=UPI0026254E6C